MHSKQNLPYFERSRHHAARRPRPAGYAGRGLCQRQPAAGAGARALWRLLRRLCRRPRASVPRRAAARDCCTAGAGGRSGARCYAAAVRAHGPAGAAPAVRGSHRASPYAPGRCAVHGALRRVLPPLWPRLPAAVRLHGQGDCSAAGSLRADRVFGHGHVCVRRGALARPAPAHGPGPVRPPPPPAAHRAGLGELGRAGVAPGGGAAGWVGGGVAAGVPVTGRLW
eukprot:scaffold26701_cov101-Isochrysis_galbana.AAC.1